MAKKTVRKSAKAPEDLKLHLAKRLPEMLTLALEAYDRITSQPTAEDPKTFTAQQGGAKAALAHMEALLKMAHSVMETPEAKDEPSAIGELAGLVARAREAVHDSSDLPEEEGDRIGGEE